jgi:hypothetical protein
MKINSFRDLKSKGFLRVAIRWVKSIVIAVGATTGTLRSVTVRTGKTGIYHHLLDPSPERFPDIFGVGVETPIMFPGIYNTVHFSLLIIHSKLFTFHFNQKLVNIE